MDQLANIGFYTLEDSRAKNCSAHTPLWRCELIVTDRCNFNCPYCRGVLDKDRGDLTLNRALRILNMWIRDGLKNVRFSGGEPSLWPFLNDAAKFCSDMGVSRIAVSTNGSADLEYYLRLIGNGVNDFSISLDSCCSATGEKMSGRSGRTWDKVVSNIEQLSNRTYVTVGVVLTGQNMNEVADIVGFASSLGVADIRLITAAQVDKFLPYFLVPKKITDRHPILKYRLNNIVSGRGVRGITVQDNRRCPLVLDDMAVLNGKHYPCIIYMREHGDAIGLIGGDVRHDRELWYRNHDCFNDPICRNNCLDVCIDYNNRVAELNDTVGGLWPTPDRHVPRGDVLNTV